MRQYFLSKWIAETAQEMAKAKKEHNFAKLAELTWLREELLELREK